MTFTSSHAQTVMEDTQLATVIQTAEYNLLAVLKPSVFRDGDQWCVMYGENLQDGIAGFGKTPYEAVLNFNKAWNIPLSPGALTERTCPTRQP